MSVIQRISDIVNSVNRFIEQSQDIVSKDWFQNYWPKVLLFVIAAWCYIDLRYECESAIYENNRLQEQLKDVRYTTIARWGELTGKNKPEVIRRKVAEASVELHATDEPPTRVK